MKNILYIALFLISFFSNAQEVQEIYHKAKVYYSSTNDLIKLSRLDIPIDHGINENDKSIISDFSVSEIQKIKNTGFTVDILIENMKEYFLQNNKAITISRNNEVCENFYETPSNWNFGSMGGYYTYQEFLDEINDMHDLYPNLITAPESISTFLTNGTPDNSTTPSIGENPIMWLKISDNPNSSTEGEPETLHTAVHHAREPTSLSQLLFFMWYLLENYETDIEVKNIVDHTELYFIPVVNPDGYLYNEKTDPDGGGYWRKNRFDTDGVDVNRNYDYFIDGDPNNGIWGGQGTSSDPTTPIYHGTAPFSEIESQAVKWFCEQHNFILGLNHHSYGNGIFFPYGYTANAYTPEHELYLSFLEELTSKNDYFYLKTNGLAGTANDFMYGTIGTHDKIYSLTPEIGKLFWLPMEEIIAVCKDMMYLNITSSKMTNGGSKIIDNSSVYIGNLSIINHDVIFKNLGLEGNGNFTLSMNPISSNITSVSNPVSLTNLSPMEEVEVNFSYTLQEGTAAGEEVSFEIISDNGTFQSIDLVNKKFGLEEPIFQDFGISSTDNFETNDWLISSDLFFSPPSSITDSFGDYTSNTSSDITISESFNLTNAAGASASFYGYWSIEGHQDFVQFQVSTDNGVSWISQCGLYTNESSGHGVQPNGAPLYDEEQNVWIKEQIDLSDYLGENIRIRFLLQTNEVENYDGFYFDDLTINIVENEVLATNDIDNNLFNIYPNPVHNILNIMTPLSNYTIELYTIQGQLIKKHLNISKSTTLDYSQYADGIYFMKLSSEKKSKTYKIIKE